MKRTGFRRPTLAQRRRAILEKRRRSGKRHIVRVGETPRLPSKWSALCVAIRTRDNFTCRRCGRPALFDGFSQVDHCIPRQLGGGNEPRNLTCLCRHCHGWKSSHLEPALYRGDVLAFREFLSQIGEPQPLPQEVEAALGTLRQLLDLKKPAAL